MDAWTLALGQTLQEMASGLVLSVGDPSPLVYLGRHQYHSHKWWEGLGMKLYTNTITTTILGACAVNRNHVTVAMATSKARLRGSVNPVNQDVFDAVTHLESCRLVLRPFENGNEASRFYKPRISETFEHSYAC